MVRGSVARVVILSVGVATLLAGAAFAQDPPPPAETVQYVQGNLAVSSEVIVGYEEGSTGEQRSRARSGIGATLERSWPSIGAELLGVGGDAATAIRTIENAPGVDYAEPNYVYKPTFSPNDPLYRHQPVINGQWNLRRVGAPGAWRVARGRNIEVTVIDTGVRDTHEDLDAGGKIVHQRNAVTGAAQAPDTKGHGTKMAGVIAAETNNGVGIAGVAPLSRLAICKAVIGDSADGRSIYSTSAVIDCVHWSHSLFNSHVVSMSFASLGFSQALQDEILLARSRGVNFVAAAGNNNDLQATDVYPASLEGVIGVGASGVNNQRWVHPNGVDGQNCGPHVDVTAPAYNILGPIILGDHRYARGQATSHSTATVAGVLALIRSAGKSANVAENDLLATATDVQAPGDDTCSGHGLVNANAAVKR